MFDENGDGRISKREIARAYRLAGFNPTGPEVEELIKEHDANGRLTRLNFAGTKFSTCVLFSKIQSTLVISTSFILNNRLSRRENLALL